MSQFKTYYLMLFCLLLMPLVARASVPIRALKATAARPVPVRKVLPLAYQGESAAKTPTGINFNSLIDRSSQRKAVLAERVKKKTKLQRSTSKKSTATNYKFDDLTVRWPAKKVKRSDQAIASVPKPKPAAPDQGLTLQLVSRPASDR